MTKPNKLLVSFGGWLICALGAIYYAYEYFLRISPSAMEMPLREHFGLTATGFGLLSAVYYYAYVPMQLPVGVLMDRFGPRRLLTTACLICVIGTFMFGGTQQFALSAVGRFLVGFGSAFAFVGVLKLATIWLPENKLAMIAGMTSALGTVGAMVGDNVLGGMVNKTGWQTTVYYSAVAGVVLTIVLWFGIHDKQESVPTGTVNRFRTNLSDLWWIVRHSQIWINGLFGCLVYLPTTVFAELWGIPYLMHAHGLTTVDACWANSLLFLGFTVGAPLMGLISDTIRRRKPTMVVGSLGAVVFISMVLYVPHLKPLAIDVLMFLLGLFYSAQTIVFVVGREVSPQQAAGTAIAITNMIVMIGAMFLQPLVGRLLDYSFETRTGLNKAVYTTLGQAATHVEKISHVKKLYTLADYRFALSIIPLGILIAAFLTLFIRETNAKASIHTRPKSST